MLAAYEAPEIKKAFESVADGAEHLEQAKVVEVAGLLGLQLEPAEATAAFSAMTTAQMDAAGCVGYHSFKGWFHSHMQHTAAEHFQAFEETVRRPPPNSPPFSAGRRGCRGGRTGSPDDRLPLESGIPRARLRGRPVHSAC